MADLGLEPIEWRTLQVRKGECHSRLIIGKIGGLSRDVHGDLENKSFNLVRIGTIEGIRIARLDCAMRLLCGGTAEFFR